MSKRIRFYIANYIALLLPSKVFIKFLRAAIRGVARNRSDLIHQLDISLSTHDADGVTEKDFEMAKIIDELIG